MIGAFIMPFAACKRKITWLDFLRRMQNESNYGRQTKGCQTPQNEPKKDEAKFMRKDLAKLADEQVVQKIAYSPMYVGMILLYGMLKNGIPYIKVVEDEQ